MEHENHDDIIEILESNVNDIVNVTILEERIKDGSEVFFNDQQIKSYLTTLLYEDQGKNDTLSKKVEDYFSLFEKRVSKTSSKTNITKYVLHPIVSASQNIYNVNDDEYEVDKETEKTMMVDSMHFDAYLAKFTLMMKDKENPYNVVSKKLWQLTKPFASIPTISTKTQYIDENIDIIDSKKRAYRAITRIQEYEGDDLEIIGFYNKGINRVVGTTEKPILIQWDDYMAEKSSLKDGDKVTVYFNDFIFLDDVPINFLDGKVNGENILFTQKIRYKNTLATFLSFKNDDTPFYVFKKDTKLSHFSKRIIFTKRCKIISKQLDGLGLYAHLHPTNITQALFILYENCKDASFEDIEDALKHFGYSFDDLEENSRSVLDFVISEKTNSIIKNAIRVPQNTRRIPPPPKSKAKLLHDFKYDYNLANLRRDKGLYTILDSYVFTIKDRIESMQSMALRDKIKLLKAIVEKHKAKSSKLKDTSGCTKRNIVIAKEYHTLKDVTRDNSQDCYWDTEIDETLYTLKKDDIKNVNEMKALLLTKPKIKSLPDSEIEFEAKSILIGKRLVRDGEHAILTHVTSSEPILFERRHVEGKPMWIKISKYEMCKPKDGLDSQTSSNVCIYDTYENVCKEIENFTLSKAITRLNTYIQTLTQTMELVNTGGINLMDQLQTTIVYDFYHVSKCDGYESILRNIPLYNYGHSQDFRALNVDLMEGNEVEMTFEDLSNNLEAQDFDYAPLALPKEKKKKPHVNMQTITIIDILKDQLEITFKDEHMIFMTDKLSKRENVAEYHHKLLLDEKAKLMSKVKMDLYYSVPKYRDGVDAKINEKLAGLMKEVSSHYYVELIYAIGLITCVIHALYPNIDIQKMVPNSITYFSPIGYPLTDSTTKALDIYIISAIKQSAIQGDVRYMSFLQNSLQNIITEVRKNIDMILKDDYVLAQSVDMKKSIFETMTTMRSKFMMTPLRPTYKPCFEFVSQSKKKEIQFVKSLHQKVMGNDFTKVSISNRAFISNSCCPQHLREDIDYYKEFTSDAGIRSILGELKMVENEVKHEAFIPYELFEQPKKDEQKPSISLKRILHANVMNIDDISSKENKNDDDTVLGDDVFENDILPNLSKTFFKMREIIYRYIDSSDSEMYNTLEKIFIRGENTSIPETRNMLYSFIRSKLPLLLGRIKHKYQKKTKISKSDTTTLPIDEYTLLIKNILNNSEFEPVLHSIEIQNIHDIRYYENKDSQDVIIAVKNIALMMKHMLEVVMNIIQYPIDKKLSLANVQLSCTIVDYILKQLYIYYQNNVLDSKNIMKRVEELREEKKQFGIDKFDKNDDNRAMQIAMRDLGVPGWENLFTEKPLTMMDLYDDKRFDEDDNPDLDGPDVEERYDYDGQNGEDDRDEDVDFVRNNDD